MVTNDPFSSLRNAGLSVAQIALMGGGLVIGFILPIIIPRLGSIFPYLGVAMMSAGGMWYIVDKNKAVANTTYINKRNGFYYN